MMRWEREIEVLLLIWKEASAASWVGEGASVGLATSICPSQISRCSSKKGEVLAAKVFCASLSTGIDTQSRPFMEAHDPSDGTCSSHFVQRHHLELTVDVSATKEIGLSSM